MKARVLAAVLAALAPQGARADWTLVGAEEGVFRAYADRDTIRRAGAGATMQGLYDFVRGDFTPDGRPLQSTRVHREYDCEGRRVRLMAHVDHEGRMGEGVAVATGRDPGRWEPVVAASLDERFWTMACGVR